MIAKFAGVSYWIRDSVIPSASFAEANLIAHESPNVLVRKHGIDHF